MILDNSPLVSAIITTHNRLSLLKKALDSVFNQTYASIECIVVDDASTDGTKEYCSQLTTITYIRIETNESKGGNYARNLGIRQANGKYVAFLDDDDEWLPEKTALQVEFLDKNPKMKLVYCGKIIHLYTNTKKTVFLQYPKILNRGKINKRVLYTIPCVTSTMMVHKDVLFNVGLFDESLRFWQEYEITIRICQIAEIDFIYQCLTLYRKNTLDENRLSNKYKQWVIATDLIRQKHEKLYRTLSFNERWMQKVLLYSDAKMRCRTSNDKPEYRKNLIKFLYYRILTLPYKCCEILVRSIITIGYKFNNTKHK
jgi:glycosyltransferase involved in cell wall biosynthesis